MKPLLFFLLISSISFSQINTIENHRFNASDYIACFQGEWYLSLTEIVNPFKSGSENGILNLDQKQYKKIEFRKDTLIEHPDTTTRFYVRGPERHRYTIEYDSLFEKSSIKIIADKKRKIHEVASYEIVRCATDELVIKSRQNILDGIDDAYFDIVYTYRRKGVDELLSKLEGKWSLCSENHVFLVHPTKDTLHLKYTRDILDSNCTQNGQHISRLDFYREKFKNYCSNSSSSNFDAVFGFTQYAVDVSQQHLIFGDSIYHIDLINEKELVLSLVKDNSSEND